MICCVIGDVVASDSRENAARGLEDLSGIGPAPDQASQGDRLVLRRAFLFLRGRGIPADLSVDGLAQPQALVPELRYQLGFLVVLRCIDAPNGFQ